MQQQIKLQENTDPPTSFRCLASISNTAISYKISWSDHLPKTLQKCFERALEEGYHFQKNEIRSNDTKDRSIACWKCGDICHFHRACLKFGTSS